MSARLEIHKAIEKLTALRKSSDDISPMPWETVETYVQDAVGADVANCLVKTDAKFLLLLRQTVDAQLALLTEGFKIAEFLVSPEEDIEIINFLALARAINGRESK